MHVSATISAGTRKCLRSSRAQRREPGNWPVRASAGRPTPVLRRNRKRSEPSILQGNQLQSHFDGFSVIRPV